MNTHPTPESFLKDVEKHELTVIQDAGLHRHLRFKKPKTTDQYFALVTFPGTLVYHGDMGCYVFSRIDDMLQFFRRRPDQPLGINPGYWSEKLDATDRPDGHRTYSSERFVAWVNDRLESYEGDSGVDEELREAVQQDILNHAHDGDFWAFHALQAWDPANKAHARIFSDLDGFDSKDYTFRFIWACYAIVWGIEQYDALLEKSRTTPNPHW